MPSTTTTAERPSTLFRLDTDHTRASSWLDALTPMRAIGVVLVVVAHVMLTDVAPLGRSRWQTLDRVSLLGFDRYAAWLNGFIMPLYFLMAGMAAHATTKSRTFARYIAHRARRLLVPLLFGMLAILPLSSLLFLNLLLDTGRCTLDEVLSLRFRDPWIGGQSGGLGHLWFLEYLFLVCVLWAVAHGLMTRLPARLRTEFDKLLASAAAPIVLVIPTAVLLVLDSDIPLLVTIPIVPSAARLVHYAWFFSVGGVLISVESWRARLARWWFACAVISLASFAAFAPLLDRHRLTPLTGAALAAYCALGAIFAWSMVFALLGACARFGRRGGALMGALARSSLWVYITHVPLVIAGQWLLLEWPLPRIVRCLLVGLITLPLCVLSYDLMVCSTPLNAIFEPRLRQERARRRGATGWIALLVLIGTTNGLLIARIVLPTLGNNLHEAGAAGVYRSGRLTPRDLDRLILERRLHSVVNLTGATERETWLREEKQICALRGVEMAIVPIPKLRPPTRDQLTRLVSSLEGSRTPVLVHDDRGLDRTALACAVWALLNGRSIEEALSAFEMRAGHFGPLAASPQAATILCYRDWLATHAATHSPKRFRGWVSDVYSPEIASRAFIDPRSAPRLVARRQTPEAPRVLGR